MMHKITIPEDCGNAPKKAALLAFITALCNGERAALHGKLSDTFRFRHVGTATYQGSTFEEWCTAFGQPAIQSLDVKTVLTHGQQGAIEGTFMRIDGSHYSFCALCNFTGNLRLARIGMVTGYLLDLSGEKSNSSHSSKKARQ